jgi:hypothetical protein
MKPLPALFVLLLLGASVFAAETPVPEKIDFNRDVRPILSDLCFKCHGFDDKARKAGRRLDTAEGALAETEGVRAVVPGKLAESELHVRIRSTDKDEAMPPSKTGKKLNERQKTILDRWIEQGAPYAKHWSFEPVRQAPPPVPTGNPIDAFIRARLEQEGLAPSPEADPYTLCRRLSLDLIGLPPTPEEADRFAEAARANMQQAVDKLVDRLLAAPQYGERWARPWLDLARYADTNGYEKDRNRSIWPWRDWVIAALNADMPFDQFTIEQLAGDLLPNATPSQIIATGFHRNTMLNEEGGIDPLEYRFLAMTDRMATTGTTWLGLTIGCAQCHSHKYDPILHREYYQLMAFLDNADEPEYRVKPENFAATKAEVQAKINAAAAALPARFPVKEGGPTLHKAFAEWAARASANAVRWTVLRPTSAKANLPLLTVLDDNSVLASGDQTKTDTYTLTYSPALPRITAVRIEALPDESLPNHGPGRTYYEGPAGDFTLTNFTAEADGQPRKFSTASESFASGKFTAAQAIDENLQTGWSINGGQGKAHQAVFQFAEPLAGIAELKLALQFARHYSAGLGRFRVSVTDDPRGLPATKTPPAIEQILVLSEAERTPRQHQAVFEHFLMVTPELAEAHAEIEKLRKSFDAFPTTLVMKERPPENPRPTFLHTRGEYLQPAEQVQPAVPSILPPLPAGARPDRLAFARWLVSPENPLTARVTVNRQWAVLFGRGLVKTTEDFGLQGSPPSHPELLDWLAAEFVKEGWSLKKLHRLIVTSATYRQSSIATTELMARDPENVLLARGPRGRLEAEQIRDATLSAAGLLSLKMGGPSVYPPQAEGVSEVAYGSPKWNTSQGEDRYRRGLYTFTKRTAPYAMFNTFDAPTGEACIARREVSNNPLQALTLLNDVVFVEAAQALGKSFAVAPGSVEERVQLLFRRVLTRPPSADETATLAAFFSKQLERFSRDEKQARDISGDAKAGTPERAAWTALARALFNLDEAITRS